MDRGDIWLPQKIAPMPGKIPGAEADAFNHRGPINTWPQIDHSVNRKVATSLFRLPGKKDCLFWHIMRGWSVTYRLIIEKENKL